MDGYYLHLLLPCLLAQPPELQLPAPSRTLTRLYDRAVAARSLQEVLACVITMRCVVQSHFGALSERSLSQGGGGGREAGASPQSRRKNREGAASRDGQYQGFGPMGYLVHLLRLSLVQAVVGPLPISAASSPPPAGSPSQHRRVRTDMEQFHVPAHHR